MSRPRRAGSSKASVRPQADIDADGLLAKKTWQEFRDAGLLWWVNRILHLFGWAIVVDLDDQGIITATYPARTRFRGFSARSETLGFQRLSNYMAHSARQLRKEAHDSEDPITPLHLAEGTYEDDV